MHNTTIVHEKHHQRMFSIDYLFVCEQTNLWDPTEFNIKTEIIFFTFPFHIFIFNLNLWKINKSEMEIFWGLGHTTDDALWSTRLLSFEIISEFIDRKKVLKGLIHQFFINFLVFMLRKFFLTSLKRKKVDSMDGLVKNVLWGPKKVLWH